MGQREDGDFQDLKSIARRVMVERGLRPDYSPEAMSEVDRLDGAPPVDNGPRDLRELPWMSIDNPSSEDLDQLSAAEPLECDRTSIRIAIADVDLRVSHGSAVDEHAEHNTTSVYTAGGIFAMLHERLSTDLTSLNERQERAAIVVELIFDDKGALLDSEISRALVRNQAKLDYDSVSAWLTDGAAPPEALDGQPGLQAQIRIQDRVAQRLRRARHLRGALRLETLEPRAVFEGDRLIGLRIEPKNRGRELIEDFMIAANGAIARFLQQRGEPSLRRTLRAPRRWERIVELASRLGESLPGEPDAGRLEEFLARRRKADPLTFPDLSLSVVKLMGSGEYTVGTPDNVSAGHFGLAVTDYAHSTAPNRRFPDLLTQRQVKAALSGERSPYAIQDLERLALHCTEMENAASKVERRVRKSAAAMLMATRVGEKFAAIVTGATDSGTWVRLIDPPVEGMLVRAPHGLDVGDRLPVQLVDTDIEQGFVDFSALPHDPG